VRLDANGRRRADFEDAGCRICPPTGEGGVSDKLVVLVPEQAERFQPARATDCA